MSGIINELNNIPISGKLTNLRFSRVIKSLVGFMFVLLSIFALTNIAYAAPAFQAAGTAVTWTGTGNTSVAWPAHAIDDIALLFVETTGGQAATLATANGFAAVTNSPQATGTTTNGTQITVFWARATSAAMASPRVTVATGDHAYAQIITYRGVVNTGNPWDVTGGGVKAAASTSVTVTGVTTTVPDTLIVQAVARDDDTSVAEFSAETNASLTSITEQSDAGTTSGNGGGFAVWDGIKATAGATGNTTATVVSSINAFLTIALKPMPPIVSSINLASTNPSAPATAVSWTVTFSKSVTGVDTSDFSLVQSGSVAGATITSVTGSGTTWTVNANTGSGGGTLGLNLVDNDTIVDVGGTPLGGAGAGNGNFTGQVYTVFSCTQPANTPAGLTLTCVCDTFSRATINPSTIFGANWIVSTSDATGILPSIVNPGYLRLTNNTGSNAKAATVPGIFPAAGNYISVEFQQYAYNGSGADGIAVTLSDYAVPAVPGAFGGSLGYAQRTIAGGGGSNVSGFAGGWIGVAMDEYGNYQNPTEGRIGGPGARAESVGVRGSGAALAGYNWLGGTAANLVPAVDNPGSATPSLGYYYQVIVDARNEPTSTSVAVNRDTTGTGTSYSSLINIPNVYTAATAQGFTQSAVPNNWQLSFTGSTGGSTNIHEIGGLRICAQTVVPTSGGTAGGFNAIDEAYGAPPLAVQNYLSGRIFTKLVGTSFKLNVAALSNSQILTTYAAASSKTVTVKLVDNSDSLAAPALDCTLSCTSTCTSKTAVTGGTQTLTFASGATDKGQKQSPSFTINSAYQKLVAIISDGTTTACSTDSFSVRPLSIATVVSSASPATLNANNTNIFGAGSGYFSLTATTNGVALNSSNYNGVIQINPAPVSPATVTGTLLCVSSATCPSGTPANTFPPATSGTPSSTVKVDSFTYSEVGAFQLYGYTPDATCTVSGSPLTAAQCNLVARSVYDNTWTGVDSPSTLGDCVANSYSNIKDASGKYGCNFGLLPNAVVFGRFVPDHFDTVVKYDTSSKIFMPCPTGLTCPASGDLVYGNGFVYSGQPFSVQVTARNAGGSTTLNYDSAKTLSKNVTLSAYDATGGAVANPPGGNGTLTSNSVPSTAFSAGVALVTNTPTYSFATIPTAPTDIFIRAIDMDNVSSLRATASASIEGGIKVVSGRIKISNAHGSELLQLPIAVTAQYWNGITYVTSTTDSVSSFAATNVVFGNYQKNLTAVNYPNSGATSVTPASVVFVNGVASYKLAKPGTGNTGSVDMHTNSPSYLPSNTARATFGVYKGANEFIYLRENY